MSERESPQALASLGGPLAVPDAEALDRQHQQVLPRLRRFVQGIPARRRRKVLKRRVLWAGSLALSVAAVVGLWLGRAGDASSFTVEQGRAIAGASDRYPVSTGNAAGTTLRTPRGARVLVAVNTRIQSVISDEHHEELHLAQGSLQLFVPRLAEGVTFSVQTPDTKVTVHGTVFSVTVWGEGPSSQTCVEVSEGLVSVERAGSLTFVKGGQRSNCPASPAATPALPVETPPSASSTEPSRFPPAEANREATPARDSHLGGRPAASSPLGARAADAELVAQNSLLAGALQAERSGRYLEAQSLLETLLKRYPGSALRPDAERSLERVNRKLR